MDSEKETTAEEARYYSDKATFEKPDFLSYCNKNFGGYPKEISKSGLRIYRVLQKNYLRWLKEKKIEIVEKTEKNILFIEEFLIITYNDKGDVKSKKVDVDKLTDFIMNKFTFKTIYQTKTEEIFVYDGGIYLKNGRKIIQTQVEKILKEYSTNHYVREVEEKIKRLSAIDKEEFEEIPEELICLENGVLNLKTERLEPHNPKYYFKTKFLIEYNPKANCPKIKKFFQDILYEEDIPIMQEWFGFNLYKKYFIKKATILFGKKDTGKTILLNLLMTFINKKNTSGISLQRISSGDKFALSSLKNKFANVFDDLSSKDLTDQGGFKIATGGGFITAEYKFGDSFQFLNYAKHIFATNKIPPVEDIDDGAYYDRWLPIPFDNQFEKKDQDKFLLDKLTTKKELSGLLNFALKGLKRLLKNGVFSCKKNSEEIKEIMERHSNSLSAFAQDVLIEKQGNKISKDDMYNMYSIYVKDENLSRLSKSQLGRRLPKYVPYILAKIDKIRFWENVDITDLHININTFNALQKIYSVNVKMEKESSDYIYKNSGKALKTLSEYQKKKSEKAKFTDEQIEQSANPEAVKRIIKEIEQENK